MEVSPKDLRFYLLPSANPPASHVELHNRCYQLWREIWSDTLQKLGIDLSSLTGEFVRQDLIACISHRDLPVAVHLYSFFSIDSQAAREHPYFRDNYPDLYFAKLARAGVRQVMSMEYLTVHPDWRKGVSDVHVGAVLGRLALQTMEHFEADAAIAPCRRDHKVHELAYAFGGEPVIANVSNHNVDCDLVMCRRDRLKPHPLPETQALVESLWERKAYLPTIQKNEHASVVPFAPRRKAA